MAEKVNKGDRVYLRNSYGGVVQQTHHDDVLVKWPNGTETWVRCMNLNLCPKVQTTPEGRPAQTSVQRWTIEPYGDRATKSSTGKFVRWADVQHLFNSATPKKKRRGA
jgi:hypothetical protein